LLSNTGGAKGPAFERFRATLPPNPWRGGRWGGGRDRSGRRPRPTPAVAGKAATADHPISVVLIGWRRGARRLVASRSAPAAPMRPGGASQSKPSAWQATTPGPGRELRERKKSARPPFCAIQGPTRYPGTDAEGDLPGTIAAAKTDWQKIRMLTAHTEARDRTRRFETLRGGEAAPT